MENGMWGGGGGKGIKKKVKKKEKKNLGAVLWLRKLTSENWRS